MRRGVVSLFAVTFVLALCAKVANATSVATVANLTLMGGQNFIDGTASSVGGNADAVVTPVIKFSDRWSLFPTYHGYYQGTEQIQALAGGGLLFRDHTGQSLLLKSVHRFGSWKLKPSLGVSAEWLRETRDEDWGQGLYDYRKFNGGFEAEYAISSEAGARLGYDYFQLNFPNFQSLESELDPTLTRELVGEDVLNNSNHMLTGGIWSPLPAQGRLDGSCMADTRLYDDQPVVDEEGQLTTTDRKDAIANVDSTVLYPLPGPFGTRMLAQMGFRYGFQNSNQNHYDAIMKDFQSNYYDYSEWRVAPEITGSLAQNRWLVTLGGSYERRDYGSRPAQDSGGGNLSEKLNVTTILTRMTIAHPLSAHTKIRFDSSLGWSNSNTEYEAVFKYNYRMANYGVGFSYEY